MFPCLVDESCLIPDAKIRNIDRFGLLAGVPDSPHDSWQSKAVFLLEAVKWQESELLNQSFSQVLT